MSKERSEQFKAYQKEYYQRPEVKEHHSVYIKEYNQRPEVKERIKSYHAEYNKRPEVKERISNYMKAIRSTPEGKAKIAQSRCRSFLKKHHAELSDDPERMSTKFLANILKCKCTRKSKVGE